MVAVALSGLAIALGLSQSTNSDLWFDEAYSVSEATLPLRQVWPIVLREGGNMWGYILALRPLALLPQYEVVYEGPSIVLGAVSVALQFFLLRRFVSRATAALFALAFLACMGVSQLSEVRSYVTAVCVVQLLLLIAIKSTFGGKRRNVIIFFLLLVAPTIHLLLIFPAGIVAVLMLWDSRHNRHFRNVWPILGVAVTAAFLAYVNLRNPVGSSQLAWLKRSTPGQTILQNLQLLQLAVPGPAKRIPAIGLTAVAVFVGIGLNVRPIPREVLRLCFFAFSFTAILSIVGMLTNGFLALPDRYGLLLVPGLNACLGIFVGQGWRVLSIPRRSLRLIVGALIFSVAFGATADRLRQEVGYNQTNTSRSYSARGGAIFRLLQADQRAGGANPRTTAYLVSPGARLELMIWLRLHRSQREVRALAEVLEPFDVATLARDSPFITKRWMAVGSLAPTTTRVVFVDYSSGCHLPLTPKLAEALGEQATDVRSLDQEGYALASMPVTANISTTLRLMNNNCGLEVRLK